MSKKKHKFDLTHLVKDGYLAEGEKVCFVSNPALFGVVKKMPNHEYKLEHKGEIFSVHGLAQKFLGTEPPDHASKWLRNEKGSTLYVLWGQDTEQAEAA